MALHSQKGPGRKPRLASLLERAISEYFKTEMDLPGIVSISYIDVAPNMQFATVWLSVYGADEEEILARLDREGAQMRRLFAKKFVSKYIPQLRFKTDPSQSHADIIARRLKDLKE